MKAQSNHILPKNSKTKITIQDETRDIQLTPEDRKMIDTLQWNHHIELGDVTTPGRWDMPHQNIIVNCLPKRFEGRTVLDIGFNDGFYSFYAEEHGAKKVVGLEIDFRETAKLAHRLKNSTVEFYEKDMFEFHTEEGFDIVLYLGVYYHVINILESFQQVCNLTRSGGEAYIEGSLLFGRWNRIMRLPPLMSLPKQPKAPPNVRFWKPTLTALKLMLEFVGFEDVEVSSFIGSRVVVKGRKK